MRKKCFSPFLFFALIFLQFFGCSSLPKSQNLVERKGVFIIVGYPPIAINLGMGTETFDTSTLGTEKPLKQIDEIIKDFKRPEK